MACEATQSGAFGLYCLTGGLDVDVDTIEIRVITDKPSTYLPGVALFGRKGAALAAFGESPTGLGFGLLTPRDEGVKDGESTLKRFFELQLS